MQFDEDQIASYQKLIDQHRNDIKANDAKIITHKKELYLLLNEDKSDYKIDSLTTEIAAIQKQIELIHFNHFIDIKALCKPEQLASYEELSEELTEVFNQKKHTKPKSK